jgi:hypothetical protein
VIAGSRRLRCRNLQRHIQNQTDIAHIVACQVFQDWDEVKELIVVCIGEPTTDRHCVLRMKNVRCGRVVDYDRFFQISADLRQIFNIVPLVVVATFPEEPMMDDVMYV